MVSNTSERKSKKREREGVNTGRTKEQRERSEIEETKSKGKRVFGLEITRILEVGLSRLGLKQNL